MPDIDKTAIVISGGTARGAYAAGLVRALFTGHAELGPKVQIVSGTSTGSLIAPMLSLFLSNPEKNAGLLELIEKHYLVASSAVFREAPKSCTWRTAAKLGRLLGMKEDAQMLAMLGEGGTVLDTTPLRGIIDGEYKDALLQELFDAKGRVNCVVNCVSAQTGGVRAFCSAADGMTPAVFRDAIYASCLQPIFMPLQTITVENGGGAREPQEFMDGGVRDVVPAYGAWSAGATRMLLVSLFTEAEGKKPKQQTFSGREHLLDLLLRVVVGLLDQEVQDDDLLQARYLSTIGKLVRFAKGRGATGPELDALLADLIAEERAHFKERCFLDQLYIHRPDDKVTLVDDFHWDAGEMQASIDAGKTAVEQEGAAMRDFLMGAEAALSRSA